MLAHTGIGFAFIGMEVLSCGEWIAMQDRLHFYKNEHVMTDLFWISCGGFGYQDPQDPQDPLGREMQ